MSILSVKELCKIYSGNKGITNFNIEIEPGDCFAIIGHNGAGKTTTIKSITGLIPFEHGTVTYEGIDLKKESDKCKQMFAYIPDDPILMDYLTGIQYLDFICNVYNVAKDERQKRIEVLAELLGIKNDLSNVIESYSHGMKQKLAIISAFIHKPKIIILDEPFVGLDPLASFNLKKIIEQYIKDGNAVLFSSHVLEFVEKLCNKIMIIRKGQVILNDKLKNVVKKQGDLEKIFIATVEGETVYKNNAVAIDEDKPIMKKSIAKAKKSVSKSKSKNGKK